MNIGSTAILPAATLDEDAWDDVLVKQGHLDQALTEYDEALKYAPNWPALRQARAAAASRRG